ncbi:hypothetical protein KPH14_002431 [Odynerus spinipes]|uniref:Uncharacterized protein n=1 Tax=Odynerus spinipes TaxID=1348599 RepID=A0AAD9RM35_9HYME|nr:hypothetical protein KPH14_002431 [Odynerus spinipes]
MPIDYYDTEGTLARLKTEFYDTIDKLSTDDKYSFKKHGTSRLAQYHACCNGYIPEIYSSESNDDNWLKSFHVKKNKNVRRLLH